MVLGAPFSTGFDTGATDTGWVGSPGVVSGGDISEGAWDIVERTKFGDGGVGRKNWLHWNGQYRLLIRCLQS